MPRRADATAPARLLLAAPIALALAWTPARAAGDPDQAKGILVEHCAACHDVPGYDGQTLPTVEAPSLQAMADDPAAYPPERLRAFLVQPHWPMTQFRLSPRDIDNIMAFIDSLRAE